MKVWVVFYDDAGEPADVLEVFTTKAAADDYIGVENDYDTLHVQGPFEVYGYVG